MARKSDATVKDSPYWRTYSSFSDPAPCSTATEARGAKLVAEHLLSLEPEGLDFGTEYEPTPGEIALLEQGQQVYRSLCASCHAADGLGEPLSGSTGGEMMAPSLATSTRVQGHRDYVVNVLLYDLAGPARVSEVRFESTNAPGTGGRSVGEEPEALGRGRGLAFDPRALEFMRVHAGMAAAYV